MSPRLDGGAPANEGALSPRQFISRADAETGVKEARKLCSLGAAAFTARPVLHLGEWSPSAGHGGSGYYIPKNWEQTKPGDTSALDRWSYGDAVALVTGHLLDVLDIDPRNGGDRDLAELNRLGLVPTVHATAATPSGGEHLFISTLGVRKTKRGGIDLQAGVGGEGHGFVWVAPTVRRSKVDGQLRPYRWTRPFGQAAVVPASDPTRELVAWFKQADTTTSTADRLAWTGDTEAWLNAHTTGKVLSHAVGYAVKPFIDGEPFDGHQRMLKFQIHLVRLAAEGHNGVPEALTYARAVWLDSGHASEEDPAREWGVALDHAIYNYGGTS